MFKKTTIWSLVSWNICEPFVLSQGILNCFEMGEDIFDSPIFWILIDVFKLLRKYYLKINIHKCKDLMDFKSVFEIASHQGIFSKLWFVKRESLVLQGLKYELSYNEVTSTYDNLTDLGHKHS